MKVKLIILRVVLSVMTLFFVGCDSPKENSSPETSEMQVLTNVELVEELNERILEMNMTSFDLSNSLESNDTVLNLLKRLKKNSVSDSLITYSVNNLFLKLFLHHERNGCSGYNIDNQESEIAQWTLDIAKSQVTDKSQFEEITHSGFVYYLILQDSAIYKYDYHLLKSISLRIDSCLNYDSETYPKNFRP